MTRAYAESPLRLLNPRNHGRAAWVYTSSYGGGLVAGDDLDLEVRVEAGATALLSTQASTKVYRSPRPCRQALRATVADEGLLVVAPDPIVCFAGASLTQESSISLADSASLVFIDWMCAGRVASGERWQFAHYASRSEIFRAGEKRVHESLLLSPQHGSLQERLGRFNVLLVAVLVGSQVAPAAKELLAALSTQRVARRASLLVTASPLGSDGAVLRMAGVSVAEVAHELRARLRFLVDLIGDDPWARKW